MAKLESYEGLPYAYRPLDPEAQRFHLRRKRVVRMFFVFLLLCGVFVYAFLKWNSAPGDAGMAGNFGVTLQRWWQGSESGPKRTTSTDDAGFSDEMSEAVKRDTMIKAGSGNTNKPSFVEVPIETRPAAGTKGRRAMKKKDDSWYGLISPIISPSLVVVFARTGLEQVGAFFLERIAPMLDSLIPRRQVLALERTFSALERKEISTQDALVNTFIPVATTAGVALLTLFPEIGKEVMDSAEDFIKSLTAFVDTADPSLLLKYFTDTLAEGISYVLGKPQKSCILKL